MHVKKSDSTCGTRTPVSPDSLVAEFQRLQADAEETGFRLVERETLLDLLPALVAYVDARLRFIWVNRPYADWYGLAREDVIGKPVKDIVSPESWKGASAHMKAALAGQRVEYENVAFGLDGEIRAVRVVYLPFPAESPRSRGFVAFIQDITALKRAESQRDKGLEELGRAKSEIKTLKGFLPICCSCKKIRNDVGYWEILETYIRSHSEADFTHGICPDCMKRLYPKMTMPRKKDEP